MALTERYFSTAAAGAGNGTTWADRAALFSSGNWSSVITGFDFSANAMRANIEGGLSYTCSQSLASGLFTNAPTAANPLLMCGCNSSGVLLAVPDPDWLSCQPAWDDSTLPVIATTTNVNTINLTNSWLYLLKFTASARNSSVIITSGLIWCAVLNSQNNGNAVALGGGRAYGCVLSCTGSAYANVVSLGSVTQRLTNCRIEGANASSAARGVVISTNPGPIELCTIVNNGGEGVVVTSASTSQNVQIRRCVIANNGLNAGQTGILANSTASQIDFYECEGCMVTGNGGWGIDGNSNAAHWIIQQTRLRDNTSGNITGIGNYPTDLNNYTTDDSDANEYVSTGANGDFSIKNTATIWGMGFGVRDEPAASSGAAGIIGDGATW